VQDALERMVTQDGKGCFTLGEQQLVDWNFQLF